jgi:hypothetical protein
MLLKMGFTNLYFDRAVVTNLPSQAIDMTQTEYSIVGRNPDCHAQGKKLHWLPLPTFLIKKKKKKKG